MAGLDEFFEKAINTARDIGKARTARKQKQQGIKNLATSRALDLDERRVVTGENRAATTARLGQQNVDIDKARNALNRQLGEGQLDVSQRRVGVAEKTQQTDRARFERTGDLFRSLFKDGGGDQGVLNSAQALIGGGTSGQSGGVLGTARKKIIGNVVGSTIDDDLNMLSR